MSERSVPHWRFVAALLAGLVLFAGCGQAKAPVSDAPTESKDIPKLIQKLDSKRRSDRSTAADYLGVLGANGELGEQQQAVLTKLQELAQKDKEEVVKKAATDAIAKIQGGG